MNASRVCRMGTGFALSVLLAACFQSARVGGQPTPSQTEPVTHIYREVDGVALRAFVFTPAEHGRGDSAPAILLFHGGGWVVGAPDWTFTNARRYAAAGLVAISVQYRLSDERTTPIDALSDVCAAFRWVRAEAAA